jgi:CubicO group peptidase (beta-lactamase class C family)
MNKLRCNLFITGVLFLILNSCNSQKKINFEDQMNASIQNLEYNGSLLNAKEVMDSLGLKGLSVAVFENYEIAWTKTWGVKDVVSNDKMDENTTFCTASVSKPVTATLFAVLEEKGLIDLKVPVATYLKRWKLPESDLAAGIDITLEHLLSHTAGTSQHGHKDLYKGDIILTPVQSLNGEIPESNGNRKLEFRDTPGTSWRYSGGGYVIAQIAVEDYLGKSLADLAQEHLFSPLKLKNTTFIQPNEPAFFLSNVAKSHDGNGNIIRDGIQISPQLAPSGLWSTPTDMAIFMIEIQKALKGVKTKVISKEVAKRITDVMTIKFMGGWSLGWERRFAFGNHDWFSHGGSNRGMGGHIYASMEGGNGIAFFGNGGNDQRIPVLNSLRSSIIKSHGWGVPLNKSKHKTITQAIANKVIGNYVSEFAEIVPVEYKDGRLFAKDFEGGQRLELFYLGNNVFEVDQSKRIVRFDATNPADGKKYMASLVQNGVETEISYYLTKIDGKLPFTYLQEGNYEEGLKAYKRAQNNNPKNGIISENVLNNTGYQELGKKNYEIAFSVFKICTILYPKSANAFDSLGEFYMLRGDNKNALINYKKSLELDPKSENAKAMINKLLKEVKN